LYPDVVTLNQVKELKTLKKFIPYFDIPLQHISSSVLKKMGRFYDEIYIQKFIDQIKKSFPVRFIRTNLIIGFPGETKQDFDKLVKFVEDTKFDNIALFEYHDEPLAASSKLPDKVDDNEIRARFNIVEHLLSAKSKVRKGKQEIGYIMEIWQDGKIKKLTVRPRLHAPEIDSYDEILLEQVTEIFDEKNELEIGDQIMYIV
jgi:tRNA A37 methylthiotransferase MiaB